MGGDRGGRAAAADPTRRMAAQVCGGDLRVSSWTAPAIVQPSTSINAPVVLPRVALEG